MTKKMFLLLIALVVSVTSLFVACSNGSTTKPPPAPTVWTVTFDKNGGDTEASPKTKTVTEPATTVDALPEEPTRAGYLFNGWNTGISGDGEEFSATTAVSADITVYAQWVQIQAGSHIVTFDKNGGDTEASPRQKLVNPPETTIDELPPTEPTREGYIFAGWYTVSAATGGTEFTAATAVTADITVYARWNIVVIHTVTFDKNGGDTEADPATKTVSTPATTVDALPEEPTRAGYLFNGWNTEIGGDGDEFTATTTVSADITVYAQWVQIQAGSHIVTFDKNDGDTEASPRQKLVGPSETTIDELPSTEPTREGYTFVGWYTVSIPSGGIEFTAATPVTGNITVYARWEAITHTVTFDKNGGDTEPNPATKTVTTPATTVDALPAPPTRDGYTFEGWYTVAASTGGSHFTADTHVSESITVYARWAANAVTTYTVTFDKNNTDATGATDASPATKEGTASGVGSLPTPPTRTEDWGAGMVFDGWYPNADGTGDEFTASTAVSEAITVYAKWAFVAGTPTVVGDTLVHNAPATLKTTSGSQGSWSGTENADGSATFSSGAISYMFPAGFSSYDNVKLEYVSNGTQMQVILKKGITTSDYTPKTGGVYPYLPASGGGSFEFAIGDANGISMQRNNGGPITVKFTKVTFTQLPRHTITFNLNGGTETFEPKSVAEGIAIGALPTPATRGDGYTFVGWFDAASGGTAYSSTSLMPTHDLLLYAQWMEPAPSLEPINVNFTSANLTGVGGVSVGSSTASSYTYTQNGNNQGIAFKVDLGSVTLSQYDKISFTVATTTSGNSQYKHCNVAATSAANDAPAPSYINPNANASDSAFITTFTGSSQNISGTFPTSLTFTIDKAKAGNLTGVIWLAVFINAASGANYTISDFKIYQPLKVDFSASSVNLTGVGGVSVASFTASSYTYTQNGNNQGIAFKVDIGSATLSQYDKISFTVATTTSGNSQYKHCNVAAVSADNNALPPSYINPSANASDSAFITTFTGSSQNISGTFPTTLTFTIDKAKTASLTGEIWFAVFINAANGANYTISDFEFVK